MKFLRTVSTGRLLALVVGLVVAVGAGTAIAVAASGPGAVPKPEPLATAIHDALAAPSVTGITADISFTNGLINSSNFTGQSKDPILQGATGRLWLSNAGQLRLELQSSNGDAEVVVNKRSFWVSDPSMNTVYEGNFPVSASSSKSEPAKSDAVPALARIQSELSKLMQHVNVSGATPSDVGGQAAYTVQISPKHDGGLLGSAQVAWDAIRGVPLRVALYARNNPTPVLELKATNVAYGPVAASNFTVSPPAGAKVVKVASGRHTASSARSSTGRTHDRRHRYLSGVAAVSHALPFKLRAPSTLVGLPRRSVKLLDWGGKPAALITYGENLGGVAVIEQTPSASGGKAQSPSQSQGQIGDSRGLSLPTVSIHGATGQELDSALGTLLRFTSGGVAYTVIGSVPSVAAEAAARGL